MATIEAKVDAILKMLESKPYTKTGVIAEIARKSEGAPINKIKFENGDPQGYATADESLVASLRVGQRATLTIVDRTKESGDRLFINRYIESVTPF